MRTVIDVRPQSFKEFEGKEYRPYKGMPIFTTTYKTPLDPVIGETATSFYKRVREHPETIVISKDVPGKFAYGEERDA